MAIAEPNAAVRVALDRVTTLVHEAVVPIAKEDEVLEARLAAVRPVLAVMSLQMAPTLAAGETARRVVARLEEPAKRGRHGTAAAADAHGKAVALDLRHDVGVAAKPAGGLGRDQWAAFQFTPSAAVCRECCGIDVNDNAGTFAAGLASFGDGCFGEIEESLHTRGPRRLD
jgi:hypothetical protein